MPFPLCFLGWVLVDSFYQANGKGAHLLGNQISAWGGGGDRKASCFAFLLWSQCSLSHSVPQEAEA